MERKSKIKSVQVQLTTECNERCIFCRKYTWPKKHMELSTLYKVMDKYKGCTFQFSGGEPLMYDHLPDLVNLLEKRKESYKVYTNMTLKLNDEQYRFLYGSEQISVSLDGISKDRYNKIRRPLDKEHAFDNMIRNMNEFMKKVKACVVVNHENITEIPYIVEALEKNGIQGRFYPLHTNMENAITSKDLIWLEYKLTALHLMDSYYTNIEQIFEPGYFDTVHNFIPCHVRNYHRVIDEYGREYTCCYAINDNGMDINGKYKLDNPEEELCEFKKFEYCDRCTRYKRANSDSEYLEKERFL